MAGVSNYPGGFANGITIRGVPLSQTHSGKVFYVNNSSVLAEGGAAGSDGNPGTYQKPFSTIDYAIGRCTASRGDIIFVMPGHAETIANATSLAMDVAGVNIVGLGNGASKPTISFSDTSSNIPLSAANCSIQGIRLLATVDSVTAGLTISAAGQYIDIETNDTSAAVEFISPIVTTAAADNLVIKWKHRGFAAGDACLRGLDLVGCRDAVIDVDFFGIASTSVVDLRTTACDNVKVSGRFYNESAALTKNVTNNTTSTWSVEGYDAKAARHFAGSDDEAVYYTNSSLSLDTTGNPVGVDDANNAFDSSNVVANRDGSVLERLEHILDVVLDDETTNPLGVDDADNAFASTNVVANRDGSILERLEALMDPLGGYDPVLGFRVTKTSNLADGAGTDALFTVTGRCLITHLSGEVTTVIGGAATMKLTDTTNTVDLCAATTIDSDAVGTMYALPGLSAQILNGTGGTPVIGSIPNVTTPSSNAGLIIGDVQAALTISHILDAADTGAVAWVLYYKPLTASSSITAAA